MMKLSVLCEVILLLDLYLLGTAATMPLPDRALSAAVLHCCGRSILFDCGEGTQLALHKSPFSPMRIDLICLTHYHGDHIFGLPGLLQSLGTMNRTEPLYITGPDDLTAAMAPILTLATPEELPYEVRLLSMPPEGIRLHDLHSGWPAEALLTAFPTRHRVVSQGYRFHLARKRRFSTQKAEALGVPRMLWRRLQNGESVCVAGQRIEPEQVCGGERRGLTVVFSGDTAPCETLERSAREADLLVMDATYAEDTQADKAEQYGHCTFSQAAELAKRAGVRALLLTHYSAMIAEPEAYLSGAQHIFPQAVCGKDGMRATLTFHTDTYA